MTPAEIRALIEQLRALAARVSSLPPGAALKVQHIVKVLPGLLSTAQHAELFLESDPPPDHAFFEAPAMKALSKSLELLAKDIDQVEAQGRWKARPHLN